MAGWVKGFALSGIMRIPAYELILGVFGIGGLYAGKRFFIDGPKCTCKTSLAGKTVIITGANTGIGLETAVDLSKRGARVVMACRDEGKGRKAVEEVVARSQNKDVVFSQLDLASLRSVKEFSSRVLEEETHIDILINNAGVALTPYTKTEDGFELQLGVNHLGHFLLTNLLLERLKAAPAARVINVSSRAHHGGVINFEDLQSERSYGPHQAYKQSKLANVLFTRALARRLEKTNVTTYSLHPGVVQTEIVRHMHATLVSLYSGTLQLLFGR